MTFGSETTSRSSSSDTASSSSGLGPWATGATTASAPTVGRDVSGFFAKRTFAGRVMFDLRLQLVEADAQQQPPQVAAAFNHELAVPCPGKERSVHRLYDVLGIDTTGQSWRHATANIRQQTVDVRLEKACRRPARPRRATGRVDSASVRPASGRREFARIGQGPLSVARTKSDERRQQPASDHRTRAVCHASERSASGCTGMAGTGRASQLLVHFSGDEEIARGSWGGRADRYSIQHFVCCEHGRSLGIASSRGEFRESSRTGSRFCIRRIHPRMHRR